MPLWMVSMAFATEPIVITPDPNVPTAPRFEVLLAWGDIGFRAAVPEAPAMGPDRLALGPNGAAALYDPVDKQVVVIGGARFPVPAAEGLAFASAGVVLVLDGRARMLHAFDIGGAALDSIALPGIVPPGGTLSVEGVTALSVDVFGNGHPIATVGDTGALTAPGRATLVPPARQIARSGDSLVIDGQHVASVSGRGGGRVLGDWLLVEAIDKSGVSRAAIPLDGGATVSLPVTGRLYAPVQDVAVGPDGDLGWIEPREDGLHFVRVTP